MPLQFEPDRADRSQATLPLSGSRTRWLVLAILLIAIAVRAIAFSPYAIHHPDEAFQYLEQAHRLAFGSGALPWEERAGMRSPVVPLLLAGPMRLGELLWPGSILYIVLARLAAAAVAFASVPAAWWLGRRVSVAHGLIALFVAATWYETVYFSVHVLTEPLAVAAFLVSAALLVPGAAPRRLIAGGASLALCVIFRFHYAPAAALFALWTFGLRWREWRWIALGGALLLAGSGLLDVAMGRPPFGWVVENLRQNIVNNKAAEFGTLGPLAYFRMIYAQWQWAFVPILVLAWIGRRHFPALFAVALCNLALHLLIGHKEYRFLLLTSQLLVFLAAIGSADLAARWRQARPAWPAAAIWGLPIALWAGASAMLAFSAASDLRWRGLEGGFQLAREVTARKSCGLAIAVDEYWATGGQAFVHTPTPLYFIPRRDAAQTFAATAQAYDTVIGAPGDAALPRSYRVVECRGAGRERLCMAVRAGGCRRDAITETMRLQRVMERYDR